MDQKHGHWSKRKQIMYLGIEGITNAYLVNANDDQGTYLKVGQNKNYLLNNIKTGCSKSNDTNVLLLLLC